MSISLDASPTSRGELVATASRMLAEQRPAAPSEPFVVRSR